MTMTSRLRFETVDVFTEVVFEGNPLAIVHISQGANISQKQKGKIAKEFNLSETIFIHENVENPLDRKMDTFIPTPEEIPFGGQFGQTYSAANPGHPTIGALTHIGRNHVSGSSVASITLHIKAGKINATYDPTTGSAVATIPHDVRIHEPATAAEISEHQPGLAEYWKKHIDREYPVVSPVNGMCYVLIDLDSLGTLGRGVGQSRQMTEILDRRVHKAWKPTFMGAYLFVVQNAKRTAEGVHTLEIRTRMFAHDVSEDPATGSAVCTLAAYLSIRRRDPETKDATWTNFTKNTGSETRYRYEIVQGVEMGRKSSIVVEVIMKDVNGSDIDQMLLSGTAVQVMEGSLRL